jgi:hypothetical protein
MTHIWLRFGAFTEKLMVAIVPLENRKLVPAVAKRHGQRGRTASAA